MYHWITNDGSAAINRLIYMESETTVKMRNLVDGTSQTLFTQAGRAAPPAEAGSRLYIPVINAAGTGASKLRIVNALLGGVPSDFAFTGPMTASPTIAEFGAGLVTQGSHRFGYILETRTGFFGKPSPVSSGVFAPFEYTVVAANMSLTMQVTATMPADAAFIHPIMTRTDNPNRWFLVPDAQVAVPGGVLWTATMTLSFSDEDLANRATEISEEFEYLTQDGAGSGPFSPSLAVEIGQRLCYITPQKAYISDPQDFQVITEDQHSIQLPGQRNIVCAMPLRNNLYFFGPGWTYGVSDNGDRPRTWGAPELVSGGIGTTAPRGVCWKTSGDYGWVANRAGLYLFAGRYDDRPISYMNEPEWKRINWSAPHCIEVVDDYTRQRVTVSAPLDGATEPTHMLVWDYSRGKTWGDVDFSLDNLPSSFSSVAMVLEPSTSAVGLWVGPSAAGSVLKVETDRRNDNSSGIQSVYETSLMRARGGPKNIRVGCLEFDIAGSGTMDITLYGLDRVFSEVLAPITLAADPGEHPRILTSFTDENVSIRVATTAANEWLDLAEITAYMRPWKYQ